MKEIPNGKDQKNLDENELEKVNGGVGPAVVVPEPDDGTGFSVELPEDKSFYKFKTEITEIVSN